MSLPHHDRPIENIIARFKITMPSSPQQKNEDPIRGGGHRGRQGRRGGRGKKNRNRGGGGGGGGGDAGDADTARWMGLAEPYRTWLIERGIAANAADFNTFSVQQRLEVSAAYDKHQVEAESKQLDILYRQSLLAQTNPYAAISESHFSQQDSEEARNASISFYGLPSEKYCQVLGQQLEHTKVVNAHIWPRSSTKTLPLFDLKMEDIHNPRNLLRLHQSIERAFDRRELAFIAGDNDSFTVKVLSRQLMSEQLKGIQMRFADIDGEKLKIPKQGSIPYRRLLAHHSILAHRYAREKGWINDDLSAEEFNAGALLEHLLDKEAQERIKLLWKAAK